MINTAARRTTTIGAIVISGRQYFRLGFICGTDTTVKAYVLIELDPHRVGVTLFMDAVPAYHIFLLDMALNAPLYPIVGNVCPWPQVANRTTGLENCCAKARDRPDRLRRQIAQTFALERR
jgi:hypothetical protein